MEDANGMEEVLFQINIMKEDKMKGQNSNHTQKSRRGVKTRETPNRVEPSAVDVASKQRSSDATHSEDHSLQMRKQVYSPIKGKGAIFSSKMGKPFDSVTSEDIHIQQDNNSLKEDKTIDKANAKANARKKVGCSDDLTARTKAHMVHSHAEKVSVFSPVKSSINTQLARRSRKGTSSRKVNCLQGEKGRTILYSGQAATTSERVKHGSLIDKKEITSSVETNTLDQSRIRSLLIKGFTIDEVKKMTKLDDAQIKKVAESLNSSNINESSIDLYTELQRDLSKLVLIETQDGQKRDTNAILSVIKLQAELQEKKIQLDATIKGKSFNTEKVSNDYIITRDKEILEMEKQGKNFAEIAKELGMSPSSVNQALDRAKLALPDDLIGINPSFITETRGLGTALRIDILRKTKEDKMNRNQVRAWVNKLKNESR
jgi:hypothetical protein